MFALRVPGVGTMRGVGEARLLRNQFAILLKQTRLGVRRCARLLGVRVDTVKQWKNGKHEAPEGVLNELRAYIAGMVTNA